MFKTFLADEILSSLSPFIEKIAFEYDINMDELRGIALNNSKCRHMFARKPRKGQFCNAKAENGFCKLHKKSAIKENIHNSTAKTARPVTSASIAKTRKEIINMLETAVPQKTTVLKKYKNMLFLHEETDMVFEKDADSYIAVGRINGKKISELTKLEFEICERMGWRYKEL